MTEWKEYKLETVPSTSSGTENTVVEPVETTVSLVEGTVSPVETTDDTQNNFTNNEL